MISYNDYIQLKAFARQDGLLMGALWVVTLGCFVASMVSPILQLGFIAGLIATPIVAMSRLKNFRDNILEGNISFGRALLFCTMTMCYASLIAAAATLVYFYFIDNGMLMTTLTNNLSMPEVREAFLQAGMSTEEIDRQIEVVGQSRPIDFAFSIFFNCVVSSFFLALILALFGKRERKNAGARMTPEE